MTALFLGRFTPATDLKSWRLQSKLMTELTKCKIPKVFISAEKADGRLMQHNLSGVLHFIVCGRQVNALYGMVAHQWPVCQQCRRAVGEDILSTFVEE
jgi:hypothetical protein